MSIRIGDIRYVQKRYLHYKYKRYQNCSWSQ